MTLTFTKPVLLAAGFAVALTPMSAWAIGEGRGGPRVTFEVLDANGDGEVSREEMQAASTERFTSADTDGDGLLSADELSAKAGARIQARVERMIERCDANDDGMLSLEELRPNEERAAKRFERVDTDGNGTISKAEFDAMKDKRRAHRRGKTGE